MTYHIWHLTRTDDHIGYDEMHDCVVIAASPATARKYADRAAVDEGPIWSNPDRVKCKLLGDAKLPATLGIVSRDVRWG